MIIWRLHELKGSLLVSNQFVKLWIIICIYLLQYVSATVIHKPTSPKSNISYRNYPPPHQNWLIIIIIIMSLSYKYS